MWNIFKKSDSDKKAVVGLLKKDPEAKQSNSRELPAGWKPSAREDDTSYWWRSSPPEYSIPYTLSDSSTGLRSKNWPLKRETLPEWVEVLPGYKTTAWILNPSTLSSVEINLVTYEPSPTNVEVLDMPFAKVMFVANGVPFKQMQNMCRELSKCNSEELELHGIGVEKNYAMDLAGKIRDKTNGFLPDADVIERVVEDLLDMHNKWEKFPDIDDYDVVQELHLAWKDVEEMTKEEKTGKIKNEIEELRSNIQSCQKKIAKLEKDQNAIYEQAADALNKLEKHGITLKSIEDWREKSENHTMELSIEHLQKFMEAMRASCPTPIDPGAKYNI